MDVKLIRSILIMVFILLFGSRDIAYAKDFVYLDLKDSIRWFLYYRKIPIGRISLSSILFQSTIIVTIVLQLLSVVGISVLEYLFSFTWFGMYSFPNHQEIAFQVSAAVVWIFLPITFLIIVYVVVCSLFASKWDDRRYRKYR